MTVRKAHQEGSKGPSKKQPQPTQKKRKENFSLYIYKVLKESSRNKEPKGINKKAMNIVNSMIFDILDQISTQATQLIRYTNKKTLGFKEIEASVKLLFPTELANHAIKEGSDAVKRFMDEA